MQVLQDNRDVVRLSDPELLLTKQAARPRKVNDVVLICRRELLEQPFLGDGRCLAVALVEDLPYRKVSAAIWMCGK